MTQYNFNKVVTKNDLQNNIYKIIFIKMKFT